MNNEKTNIRCLSALIAPGCNLQCSYCQTAKNTAPEAKKELWENNIKALQDGSFVENIRKTLLRYHQSPYQIEGIEFWGQEPTLTLPYVTERWDEWIKAFPNTGYCFFSTNGMVDSDNIFEFLMAVDKYAVQPFRIGIQVSYDGKYGEDVVRGGSSDFILQNFLKFTEKVNAYPFKNIEHINMSVHGVISLDLVHELNTLDKVEDYFREYDMFMGQLCSAATSRVLEWHPPAFLAENCREATTEEGMAINNFCEMVERIRNMRLFPDTLPYDGHQDFAMQMAGNGAQSIYDTARAGDYRSYIEYIDDYLSGNPKHPLRDGLSGSSCSAYLGDMKIMYDGTTVLCQNFMFDVYSDFQVVKDDVSNWSRYYMIQKKRASNRFDAEEDETDEFFDFLYEIEDGSRLMFNFMTTYNLAYLMSRLGQINPMYAENPSWLKKLAFTLTRVQSCPYNAEVLTGSTLLRQSGEIREFANGLGEKIINEIDDAIKEGYAKREREKHENIPR